MTSPKFTPADAARLEEALARVPPMPWRAADWLNVPGDDRFEGPELLTVEGANGQRIADFKDYGDETEMIPFLLLISVLLPSLLAAYREQEAEIARLREALRPFALGDAHRKISGGVAVTVEESNLRRARAVLKEAEKND